MTSPKKVLIENLLSQTFCRFAPSKIHGIGVFAIKDIPKDTQIFNLCNGLPNIYHSGNIVELTDADLSELLVFAA